MRPRYLLPALALPALALIAPLPAPAQDEPAASELAPAGTAAQALAEAWCGAIMSLDEIAAVSMMTPELQAGVSMAQAANDAFIALRPDEKPPLGDGLPLTSFVDGVSGCAFDAVDATGAAITFSAAGGGMQWQDIVEFAPGPGGGLLVADVLYAPDHQVRLSQALMMAAEPGE